MAQTVEIISEKMPEPEFVQTNIPRLEMKALELLTSCNPKPVIVLDLDYTVSDILFLVFILI
jgi:hypothetical protein